MSDLRVYTDGSADNKTRKGGFGFVVAFGDDILHTESVGMFTNTTSARMEIMGVLEAFNWLHEHNTSLERVTILCDNQYVVKTIDLGWHLKWQKERWFGRKNADLWSEFAELRPKIQFPFLIKWVKGHNGDRFNEIADDLARQGFKNENEVFADVELKVF